MPRRSTRMAPSPGRKKCFALFYMCHIPFVKSLDVPTDFLMDRHTWSPHGKRKRRSAKLPTSGKRTSWLRGEQEAGVPASVDTHPVVQWSGGPFRDVRKDTKSTHEHSWKTHSYTNATWRGWMYAWAHALPPAPGGGEVPNHLVYLHLTCNHHNSAPAATTCLVHQNSVWCILSPRYQPQSAAIPSALPTMPSCLLRLHQNCPSATTKLRASLRACQPRQPVTATLNHEITCWEAEIRWDLVQNETSIMWLKATN